MGQGWTDPGDQARAGLVRERVGHPYYRDDATEEATSGRRHLTDAADILAGVFAEWLPPDVAREWAELVATRVDDRIVDILDARSHGWPYDPEVLVHHVITPEDAKACTLAALQDMLDDPELRQRADDALFRPRAPRH